MKNKTKYWRRPESKMILMQKRPENFTNEDGEVEVRMVDHPVLIQGRDLRNVMQGTGKMAKIPSQLMENLIKKNYPVTINEVTSQPEEETV
jgi:hypothetical protein